MQFKILLFIILSMYIFSGYIQDIISPSDYEYTKNIQQEILINDKEINVFEKKSIDEITVTEKKVKAWLVIIKYDKDSYINIKNKISKTNYKIQHNPKKMYYSVGPFASLLHANKESKKLIKLHGINSKVIDFIF
tara:strand:+ start:410 stop:814 length:405 start_codon:yes stop_codon:yes gene_type:complete